MPGFGCERNVVEVDAGAIQQKEGALHILLFSFLICEFSVFLSVWLLVLRDNKQMISK